MKKLISLALLCLIATAVHAQVGINNIAPNASLDITATDQTNPANTDGILIPRIDQFPSVNPGAAQNGMLVYLTTTVGTNPPGFYYWNNGTTSWDSIGGGAEQINELSDGIFDGSSLFLGLSSGTNDDGSNINVGVGVQALNNNVSGVQNVAVGYQSLNGNTTGTSNSSIGHQNLYSNTTGNSNTSVGQLGLRFNTTGNANSSFGVQSLFNNTTASFNSAFGYYSLRSNTNGAQNAAFGYNALTLNSTASGNSAFGAFALYRNTTGIYNTAVGNNAMSNTNTGSYNTAVGNSALGGVTLTGDRNTAIGSGSMSGVSSATDNVALGYNAMNANQSGVYNIAIGSSALTGLARASYNIAIGRNTLATVSTSTAPVYNIAVGDGALNRITSGSYNIGVGNNSLDAATSGRQNTATGAFSLTSLTTGINNTAYGYGSGSSLLTGSRNTYIGHSAGLNSSNGLNNTYIGASAGQNANGTGNVFIGYQAGLTETGSNRLIIDNVNTTSPLIWGDFATNDFRINGGLQVGNPGTTGYEFPAFDGAANQVLQTNGTGTLSWGTVSGEWTDGGAYLYPADGTTENILIGTTVGGNYKLGVSGTLNSVSIGPTVNSDIIDVTTGLDSGDGLDINMTSSYNLSSRSALAAFLTYGNVGADVARFETGSGNLYGLRTTIGSDFSGTEYGVYSQVLTSNGHAGYFLGDLTVGTTTVNTYTFPAFRGSAGQIMQTDGVGNVSWVSGTSLVSPTNGLSNISSSIGLGGTLTQTTTLNHSFYDLTHNLTSSGDFAITGSGIRFFEANTSRVINIGGNTYWRSGSTTGGIVGRMYNSGSIGVFDLYNGGIRTRITSSGSSYFNGGNVGIGTFGPNEILDVEGVDTTGFIAEINNTSNTTGADALAIRLGTSLPTTGNFYVGFYGSSTFLRGRISGNGIGGVSYNTTSDARLKTNFKKVDGALEMISRINPQWYEYKTNLGQVEMGFLAQDLQKVFPNAVSGSEESDPTTDPMMVDYGRITPLLTAGIQELQQKVNTLEDNVADLEAENAALKATVAKYEALEARIAALEGNKSEATQDIVAQNEE